MKTISRKELKELYHRDFPLWAEINYELLKEKHYELVDWENLLEEIESMGRQEINEALRRLVNILVHMYKWDYMRAHTRAGYGKGGHGWIRSVENERRHIRALIRAYPSIGKKLPAELQRAWYLAIPVILEEAQELGLNLTEEDMPEECPYTYEQAMTRDLKEEIKT